MKKDVAQFVSS